MQVTPVHFYVNLLEPYVQNWNITPAETAFQ